MPFLTALSSIVLGVLLLLFLHLLINLLCFRRLRTITKANMPDDPLVSVLIPARNEEAHIEKCVRSLLGQCYEKLEVLVLDDQSNDATATIVQRFINDLPLVQRERLRLFSGQPLPPGWVGKNFACHQLFQHARGDYLFFTDADTVHAPETVRAVVDWMRRLKVDLLTAQAAYEVKDIGERLIMPLLCFRVFILLPLTLIERCSEPILAAGNGPLLCFSQRAYKAAGGHRAIKTSILEDVLLARAVKAAGYRIAFMDAVSLITCHMYASFVKTWVGFSKTFFAFYNYSLVGALAIILLDLGLFVFPPLLLLIAFFASLPQILIFFSLVSYGIAVLMRLLLALRFTRSQKYRALMLCFFHPVAIVLGCLILLNSIYWYYRKLGTLWKGRYYSS